jgi:hypothetical protein
MRARTVVIVAGIVLTAVVLFNLFFQGYHALYELPKSRIELERDEALRVAFTDRPHRLERRPRLEADDGAPFFERFKSTESRAIFPEASFVTTAKAFEL